MSEPADIAASENPRAWLKECCRPGYQSTELPFPAEWHGETWDCASNGHAIVFLHGATVPARDGAPKLTSVVQPEPDRWFTARFSDLCAWAECSILRVRCSICKGRGELFGQGRGSCPGCEGDGDNPPDASAGMIADRVVDRRLLWRFIRHLQADQVNVGVVSSDSGDPHGYGWLHPIWITAGTWMVLLMPMRALADECEVPPFTGQESAA